MRKSLMTGLAGILALLFVLPAYAADSKQTSDIDFLGSFDIIIGDTGDRFDGWDDRDTRVYVEVFDGRQYHDHYFDNLPAMMFVLRERYGRARITELGVPEFAGLRHESHGHEGHGLIDGQRAWYLWDYGHYSRGATPLVLAFYDYDDAWDEARYRDADVLSYEELISCLNQWADQAYSRTYWRGWDHDRWNDHRRWNHAWDQRWRNSRWDRRDGWSGVQFRLGDFTFRWDTDGYRRGRYDHDRRDWDRDWDRNYDRDRDYDRDRRRDGDGRRYDRDGRRDREVEPDEYHRDDDEGSRERERERTRQREQEEEKSNRERNRDRQRERDREKEKEKDDSGKGKKRTQEK